jgi:hypothetical protein
MLQGTVIWHGQALHESVGHLLTNGDYIPHMLFQQWWCWHLVIYRVVDEITIFWISTTILSLTFWYETNVMLIYDSCIILYIYCCKYVLMPVATHGHVPSVYKSWMHKWNEVSGCIRTQTSSHLSTHQIVACRIVTKSILYSGWEVTSRLHFERLASLQRWVIQLLDWSPHQWAQRPIGPLSLVPWSGAPNPRWLVGPCHSALYKGGGGHRLASRGSPPATHPHRHSLFRSTGSAAVTGSSAAAATSSTVAALAQIGTSRRYPRADLLHG